MMNNKGMTLIELLISIVLISTVLVFLFQILIDLRNETDNNSYAYNNQIKRAEIIYTIQNDLNNYALVGITDNSSNDNLILNFHFKNGEQASLTRLETEKKEDAYYLRYTSFKGEKTSWKMEGAMIDPCALFTSHVDQNIKNYYYKLNIFVYNEPYHDKNNREVNNAVDDIEISYTGSSEYLDLTNEDYLTNKEYLNEYIGACTNKDMH